MLITPPIGVGFGKCSLRGCFCPLRPIIRRLSAALEPLLFNPAIIVLPDPSTAFLTDILHRLGLDVITTIG